MTTQLQKGWISCPVDGCPTSCQRIAGGSLVEGLAAHLGTVHRLPGPRALDLATSHYLAVTE